MHVDQSKKAEELIAALGILARAQEFEGRTQGSRVNDDELSELTASVQEAEHAFRAVYQPVQ
ncbi:MAG: hypothetical protein IIA53_00245 [Chloroflexi bacterium]|nr:hypothetical protein [Chloroflexota bacterium]